MANTHSLDLEASSSQYASISDASQTGLDITGDITIEAWVKLESQPSGASLQIVSKYNTSSQRAYEFNYNESSGTRLRFLVSNNGTADDVMSVDTTLTTGVWTHVAVNWDASASTAEFFVNGLSIGTDTGTATSIYNSTSDVAIGARPNASPTNFFDGLIDDVRVWSDVRTESEIQDNLGKELVGNEANLVGYWKLNNDYTDSTSNGNDLTASGSPVFSTDVPFEGISFSISEVTTLTESITNLRTRNTSTSETVTLTETPTTTLGKIFSVLESVSLSEGLSTTRTFITNIIESVSLSEVASVFKKWTNDTKNSASWTNDTKNSASWTNEDQS